MHFQWRSREGLTEKGSREIFDFIQLLLCRLARPFHGGQLFGKDSGDALLFGKGWEGNGNLLCDSLVELWSRISHYHIPDIWTNGEGEGKKMGVDAVFWPQHVGMVVYPCLARNGVGNRSRRRAEETAIFGKENQWLVE